MKRVLFACIAVTLSLSAASRADDADGWTKLQSEGAEIHFKDVMLKPLAR